MFDFASKCWFLTGPTASGKTTIALELSKRIDAEIVSMDSMAIYRAMDIGTAKPTQEQRNEVPHHLIDIRDPNELFSIFDYVELAESCVEEIHSRGRQALFVGGTPLYLKALLRGLFDGPPPDPDFRSEIQDEIERVGVEALHARLQLIDPVTANRLHTNDVRRIIRALEVFRSTGQPISHLQLEFDEARSADDCRVFVLAWPRPDLHERIEQRVDSMFRSGLVDEVRTINSRFHELSKTAAQAVGYAEVQQHLRGEADLKSTIERAKTRTRQFAKRQDTWFRSLNECRKIERNQKDSMDDILMRIVDQASNL